MRESALLSHRAPRPNAPAPCDPDRWAPAGVEPTVEDLMADPLTAMIMRRDRIGADEVMAAVTAARRALGEPATEQPASAGTLLRPPLPWRASARPAPEGIRLPLATAV